MISLGVVKVRYQKTDTSNVMVLAQKKGVADGVSKPANGMATHNAEKVKALLKCSTGQRENPSHHNGSVVNGM